MCAGVALTALLFFLVLLSLPLYLVGLGLVLASGQALWRKALAIAFPVVAWVGLAAGAWALAPRASAATFLIPAGFEGTLLLVQNEPCGLPPAYENGRRLYRVPANGLLITSDTVPNRENPYYSWPHRGYFQRPDNRYYLVDGQGHRLRELLEVQATTDSDGRPELTSSLLDTVERNELAVFYGPPMQSPPDSAGTTYTFQYLTITTQNRLDLPKLSDA